MEPKGTSNAGFQEDYKTLKRLFCFEIIKKHIFKINVITTFASFCQNIHCSYFLINMYFKIYVYCYVYLNVVPAIYEQNTELCRCKCWMNMLRCACAVCKLVASTFTTLCTICTTLCTICYLKHVNFRFKIFVRKKRSKYGSLHC